MAVDYLTDPDTGESITGRLLLMGCNHDWNTTSALRLVVETGDDVFASIFPMPPKVFPIDYCRDCGALRIPTERLARLRSAEREIAGKS